MKNKFSKILLSFGLVVFGSFFFSLEKVEAACVVNQANFRIIGENGQPIPVPATGWYTDINPPFVYIDFQTTGCTNGEFNLSIIYTGDNQVAMGDPAVTNFINRPISNVPQDNFTLAVTAGDDMCGSQLLNPNPLDCAYYIRINNNQAVTGQVWNLSSIQSLKYDCDDECDDKNWEFIGILQEYQGIHPLDTPDQNGQGGGEVSPTISGAPIDINIQNPIGPSNMTLVDFIDKVIKFALTIGIPIIAIAIIYSGLLFVTARGNDSQLETAKNAFTYAVIGGAILLGSFIFAKLIKETIESIAMISSYFV